ncbi:MULTISPECIES: hypothetical protein [Burkholderia]|uniref:hypothetical protein n=1 Tax=Burkholderia TaxID=32008 RepID=UPI00094FC5AB|nr:hypothetical protein [Burkholderia humptydooensis]ATF37401.1 hypothetical protein CO709_32085 [Burkholderia thailandensis]
MQRTSADERQRIARRRRGRQSRNSNSVDPVFNWLGSTRLVYSIAVISESRPGFIENIIE